MEAVSRDEVERCFVDLHCHTSCSFDSLNDPAAVVRAAARRGITHLAITDHDRIDCALRARELAPEGFTVIVGEEVKSADGDLIALYLHEPVPPGLSAAETIAAVRAQGGLVGAPHPFDRLRGSVLRGAQDDGPMAAFADDLDYVEVFNARVAYGAANDRAADFAAARGLPGVAVSDAHTLLEVGIAYTILPGPLDGPDDLRAALAGVTGASLMPGRASFLMRGMTPLAKLVQRLRGNRRVAPGVSR